MYGDGDATFDYQLRAFVAAVRDGSSFPTDGADATANKALIDDIYEAAGLGSRPSRNRAEAGAAIGDWVEDPAERCER